MNAGLHGMKAARNRKGYTQTDIANRLGVQLYSVQRWEACQVIPRPATLEKLAMLLGVSVPELFGGNK